ncbi:MAG: FAD-binding protein [Candidatus Helarchaeota archaeon]
MKELVNFAKQFPDVVVVEESVSLCTESGAAQIAENIKKHDLNRIIVAACTPITHRKVFETIVKEHGLNPGYLDFINLREQDTYVHRDDRVNALQQAKDLLRANIARSRLLEEIPVRLVRLTPEALVVGGGVAGIRTALDLGYHGFSTYIVEKFPSIGGNSAKLDRIFPTDDCCI